MDNKRILSIIGLVLTFFACLAIGFVLPIGEQKSDTLFASNTGGGGGGGALFEEPQRSPSLRNPRMRPAPQRKSRQRPNRPQRLRKARG